MNNRWTCVEGGASAIGQEVIDVEHAVRPKKQQKRLIHFSFFHQKLHNKSSIKFQKLDQVHPGLSLCFVANFSVVFYGQRD